MDGVKKITWVSLVLALLISVAACKVQQPLGISLFESDNLSHENRDTTETLTINKNILSESLNVVDEKAVPKEIAAAITGETKFQPGKGDSSLQMPPTIAEEVIVTAEGASFSILSAMISQADERSKMRTDCLWTALDSLNNMIFTVVDEQKKLTAISDSFQVVLNRLEDMERSISGVVDTLYIKQEAALSRTVAGSADVAAVAPVTSGASTNTPLTATTATARAFPATHTASVQVTPEVSTTTTTADYLLGKLMEKTDSIQILKGQINILERKRTGSTDTLFVIREVPVRNVAHRIDTLVQITNISLQGDTTGGSGKPTVSDSANIHTAMLNRQIDSLVSLLQSEGALHEQDSTGINRAKPEQSDTIDVVLYYHAGQMSAYNEEEVLLMIKREIASITPVLIILSGHTDITGSHSINKSLTAERLDILTAKLIELDIDARIIFQQNFGDLYASEAVIDGERRIEIMILLKPR